MWQVGKKVREKRNMSKIPVDPFVCGIYLAVMIAQVDVLTEKGHPGSEIANESVIEAVDSLNPFMFAKGLSSMIDNCSVTARLGARKWAPKFHYMLEEEVYPALDGNSAIDTGLINRFLNHPVHEIISVCAGLRPSVDIKVQ
jgi:ketol-acid reductoisomerase